MIPMWLGVALAGIWPMIWQFGLGGVIILALLAAAWFSPVFKKEFLWGAAVVGCFMIAFTMGVVTGEKRVRAQWMAALETTIKSGEKGRVDAESFVKRRPLDRVRGTDRFNRDGR